MADLWEGMTPEQVIDDIGDAIAERYREIERRVGAQIRRYATQAVEVPTDLTARLKAVRSLKEQAWELTRSMDPEEMARVVTELSGSHASAEIARQLLQIPALAGTTLSAGGALAVAGAEIDLRNQLRALNERIYRAPADAYQRITAQFTPEILAGRAKWEKVHERQVAKYITDGITGFTDVSGRRWTIGAYAEMATRTAASRAWRDQSVASMAAAGIETFTPVLGFDACEPCAEWAWKVLTDGGPVGPVTVPHALTAEPTTFNVDGTLQQAREAGWGHPNCRCVLVPALPGREATDFTTYSEEADAARRKMRELERAVRDAKRDGFRDEIRDAQRALKEHTDRHGLRRRSYREQLRFADGPVAEHNAKAAARENPRARKPATGKKPGRATAPERPDAWLDDMPRLDRPDTLSEASYYANPGALTAPRGSRPVSFTNNCHQVVNAVELRARGYNVRAAETAGSMGRASYSISADWVDPITGRARDLPNPNPKARSLGKVLKDATADWPEGARGFVSGAYKRTVGRGAHIINVEKVGDVVRVVEGQVPAIANNTLRNFRPSTIQVMRVDDLVPTQNMAPMVAPSTPDPPIVTPATQRAYINARIAAIEEQNRLLGLGTYGIGDPDDVFSRTANRIRTIWSVELRELKKELARLRP